MTPPEAPDDRTAYDLFWAAVEDPPRPADAAGAGDAYAAFAAAADR